MQWANRLASTAAGQVSCPQLVQRSSATLPVDEPKTALVDAQSRCHRAESQSQLKDLFMAQVISVGLKWLLDALRILKTFLTPSSFSLHRAEIARDHGQAKETSGLEAIALYASERQVGASCRTLPQ